MERSGPAALFVWVPLLAGLVVSSVLYGAGQTWAGYVALVIFTLAVATAARQARRT